MFWSRNKRQHHVSRTAHFLLNWPNYCVISHAFSTPLFKVCSKLFPASCVITHLRSDNRLSNHASTAAAVATVVRCGLLPEMWTMALMHGLKQGTRSWVSKFTNITTWNAMHQRVSFLTILKWQQWNTTVYDEVAAGVGWTVSAIKDKRNFRKLQSTYANATGGTAA